MLHVVDQVSEPAPGRHNEDIVGATPRLAWAIDGASPVEPPQLHPTSDPLWLAEFLDSRLHTSPRLASTEGVHSVFTILLDELRKEVGVGQTRLDPVCSMGIAIQSAGRVEVGVLGDVSVLVEHQHGVELVTNSAFAEVERRVGNGGLRSHPLGRSVASRRGAYIRGERAMQVFSAEMPTDFALIKRSWRDTDVRGIVMVTDGFARVVDPYNIVATFPQLAEAARTVGLRNLLGEIRRCERAITTSERIKRSDDASGIVLRVTPEVLEETADRGIPHEPLKDLPA